MVVQGQEDHLSVGWLNTCLGITASPVLSHTGITLAHLGKQSQEMWY